MRHQPTLLDNLSFRVYTDCRGHPPEKGLPRAHLLADRRVQTRQWQTASHRPGTSRQRREITPAPPRFSDATAKAKVIQFGALAALWQIAQELDVVGLIDAQVPKRDQGLSCGQYLLLAALNRCVAASSKASLYQWYRRTVLNRLLPTAQRSLASQRFWDHMNMLDSAAIGAIEQQLAQRVIDHYRIDLRLLIFDATNFDTFINSRTVSALAQRGHAKSKRADLRILGLALLVSTDYHVRCSHTRIRETRMTPRCSPASPRR